MALGAEWVMRALILALPVLAAGLLPTAVLADPPGFGAPSLGVPSGVPSVGAQGTPMSPTAFEAYATGKTLAYAQDGMIWGRETYLPGRRVLWRAVGEDCKAGHWWNEGGAVCFSYDDGTTAQCWGFVTGVTGLTATFLSEADARPATVIEESHPVPCPGPEIGS